MGKYHTIAADAINTSHAIQHLSFGDLPPQRSSGVLAGAYESANRLGGTWWSTSGSNHTHEHYIKVVNTVYTGKLTDYTTYKYTVNSHEYQDNLNYAAAKFTFDI